LRRRQPAPPQPAADPAEELRRRLEQARAEEPPAPPDEPAPAVPRAASIEDRRARVHARAQEALELMREPGSDQ
ncbi:MAG TPA: hypothetical protein VFR43_00150, partial [Gaiellaceae bacterium]|nr:hypothetical protein [Gaiellaceae bacterium]